MPTSGAAHGMPRPTRASVMAKVACSAAMHRSHICASSQPPAKAKPLTAAIVGLVTSRPWPMIGRKPFGGTASDISAASFRSMPAQNAFGPAPVRIATRAESSASKRRNAANRPARTSLLMALSCAGRSIVTSTTAPVCS